MLKNNFLYFKSLFKFGFKILVLNFKTFKKPFKLTFSLTNRCNSKCKTCNIWKIKDKKDISLEELKLFFSKNKSFNWIDLTGGEVFLREDIIEITKIIKSTQKDLFLLHIPTNSLLEKIIIKRVREIIKIGFPKVIITISIDGVSKTHNEIRGINNNWSKAVAVYNELKKMKSKHFDCYFGMTISEFNFREVDLMYMELKKYVPGLKITDIHYNLVHYSETYYKNMNQIGDLNRFDKIFKNIVKDKKLSLNPILSLEVVYQKLVSLYIKKGSIPVRCRAGEISVFINENGDIFPCTMWNKKLGSLRELDYDLNMIKRDYINTNCNQCWTPCEAYQNIMVDFLKYLKLTSRGV